MTTPNTTANISPLPSGDYIFRVAGLNSVGQGDWKTLSSAIPVPDPYFSNVALLMHMNGSGNSFVDSSSYNHTITAMGDATQSSDQSKFGGLSAYFDGSGDYLTADSSSFVFGTGDFTVEAWVYSSDVSSSTQKGWIQTSNQSGGLSTSYTTGIIVHYNNGSLRVNVAGTNISTPTSLINANQWYNIAICRQLGIVKIFVNGNLAASGVARGNCSGQYLCVGGYYDANYLLSGYIDELRITKGVARYSSNFTPSPVPFPISPIITISSQPSNQIAISGNATFSVTSTVSLGAILSYQWQKKKGNALFSNIVGATSNSLLLSNLTEADNNGEIYRCEIRSSGGVKLFTNSVVLTVPPVDAAVAEYLVVGGGGGGGSDLGGGGGAGGYKTDNMVLNPNTNYQVVVGLGGSQNISGGNSTLGLITMPGGGGATQYGTNGGSGSGSHSSLAPGVATAPTFGGLGNNGANGVTTGGGGSSSGGGGGAGSAGVAGTVNNGGAGGSGAENSITGTAVYYAAGGGGGVWGGNGGSGGSGIGGSGASSGAGSSASPANRGSGGGGGSSANPGGGSGSAGVVIVAYPDTFGVLSIDNTLTYDEPVRSGYRVYRFTAGSGNITLSST